jgi:hypothetical protein
MKDGKKPVLFKDFTSPPVKSNIRVAKLEKLYRGEILGYVIQVNMLTQSEPQEEKKAVHVSILTVLADFSDVFSDKFVLPPKRDYDHEIPLLEGSKPPNLRSYRISHKQKNEVERLIGEMLQDSIIRPSHSPYSSPAILVGKKDGSWRMCIDYRNLNSQTIKNKFPIPVIEDLLDEFTWSICILQARPQKWLSSDSNERIRYTQNNIHHLFWAF